MAMDLRMKKESPPLPVPTFRGATKEFVVAGIQSATDEVVFGTLKQVGEFGPSGAAALGYLPDVLKVAETDSSLEVRVAALAAVGQMGEVAAPEIDRVINLFDDEEPAVVCAAMGAMGGVGESVVEQAPELVPFLQEESAQLRAAAVGALGNVKAWMYGDDITKCLNDPDVSVVTAAVSAIGALGEDGQLLAGNNVVGFLSHKEASLRLAAVKTLTSIGVPGERYAEQVAALLADSSNAVREAVMAYLKQAGRGGRKAAGVAAGLLKSSNGRVQAAAALALAYVKDEEKEKEWKEYAKDISKLLSAEYKEDTSLALSASGVERKLSAVMRRPSCAAATALAMLGDEGAAFANEVDALLTEDMVPEAAVPLIRALGSMGAVSSEAKIRALLDETSGPIREAACYALGDLAQAVEDPDSAAAVAERLKDSFALVRQAAATAIGQFKNEGPAYAGEVAKLFSDKVGHVKIAAMKAMASFGIQGEVYASQVARVAMPDGGPAPVRVAAVEVLAEMGDRGSACAEDLAGLLQDSEGSVREAALKALSKMGSDAKPFLSAISKACADPLEPVRAAADDCQTALGG